MAAIIVDASTRLALAIRHDEMVQLQGDAGTHRERPDVIRPADGDLMAFGGDGNVIGHRDRFRKRDGPVTIQRHDSATSHRRSKAHFIARVQTGRPQGSCEDKQTEGAGIFHRVSFNLSCPNARSGAFAAPVFNNRWRVSYSDTKLSRRVVKAVNLPSVRPNIPVEQRHNGAARIGRGLEHAGGWAEVLEIFQPSLRILRGLRG